MNSQRSVPSVLDSRAAGGASSQQLHGSVTSFGMPSPRRRLGSCPTALADRQESLSVSQEAVPDAQPAGLRGPETTAEQRERGSRSRSQVLVDVIPGYGCSQIGACLPSVEQLHQGFPHAALGGSRTTP